MLYGTTYTQVPAVAESLREFESIMYTNVPSELVMEP